MQKMHLILYNTWGWFTTALIKISSIISHTKTCLSWQYWCGLWWVHSYSLKPMVIQIYSGRASY